MSFVSQGHAAVAQGRLERPRALIFKVEALAKGFGASKPTVVPSSACPCGKSRKLVFRDCCQPIIERCGKGSSAGDVLRAR